MHQSQNLIRVLLRRGIPLCTALNQLLDDFGRVDIFRLFQLGHKPESQKHKASKCPGIHHGNPRQSRCQRSQITTNHGQKHSKEWRAHLFFKLSFHRNKFCEFERILKVHFVIPVFFLDYAKLDNANMSRWVIYAIFAMDCYAYTEPVRRTPALVLTWVR